MMGVFIWSVGSAHGDVPVGRRRPIARCQKAAIPGSRFRPSLFDHFGQRYRLAAASFAFIGGFHEGEEFECLGG